MELIDGGTNFIVKMNRFNNIPTGDLNYDGRGWRAVRQTTTPP